MMAREKTTAATATPDPATLSFEAAVERLQTIVEQLEGGDLSLEQSIACYEEGVKLSRRLTQTLDEAQKRIERLAAGEDGELVTEPMDLEGEAAPEGPATPRPPRPTPDPGAPQAPRPPRPPQGGPGELPF
jgi:exodeoxyribonuclease VII small subunit